MDTDPVTADRISKLEAAVKKVAHGNRSEFGRKLGYKDGAFVRQMLAGTRPITEKTILQIEALHGMAGWFSKAPTAPAISTQAALPLVDVDIDLALRALAAAASACSRTKRSSLEPLFARLATAPDEIGEISQLVKLLLGKSPGSQVSSHDPGATKPQGADFELEDEGARETDGTGVRSKQEAGGGP